MESPEIKKISADNRTSVSSVLLKELKRRGYADAKYCAREMGVSYELFRKVLAGSHIPRDEALLMYAERLGLDKGYLVRLAHYERAPEEAKEYLRDLLLEHNIVEIGQLKKTNREASGYLDKVIEIFNSDDQQLIGGLRSSIDSFYFLWKKVTG